MTSHVAYTEPIHGPNSIRYAVGCETCGWKDTETYGALEDAQVEGRLHEARNGRTAGQQDRIDLLVAALGDVHVQAPLPDGTLEIRRYGRHLCFVTPCGSVV